MIWTGWQRSRTRGLISDVIGTFWALSRSSRLVAILSRLHDLSTGADRRATLGLKDVRTGSIILQSISGVKFRTSVSRAWPDSGIAHWMTTIRGAIEHSMIYRWLTAEPEPEVVVIDLRRTKSLGWLLAWIDRTVLALVPGVTTSRVIDAGHHIGRRFRRRFVRWCGVFSLITLGAVGSVLLRSGDVSGSVGAVVLLLAIPSAIAIRSTMRYDEFIQTTPIRYLRSAFEPPAAPEGHSPGSDDVSNETEPDNSATEPADDRRKT